MRDMAAVAEVSQSTVSRVDQLFEPTPGRRGAIETLRAEAFDPEEAAHRGMAIELLYQLAWSTCRTCESHPVVSRVAWRPDWGAGGDAPAGFGLEVVAVSVATYSVAARASAPRSTIVGV